MKTGIDRCSYAAIPQLEIRLVLGAVHAMGKVEPRYEILVWLAACAGFRKGEALGLKRSHIDWKQNLIYISEQRQHGKAAKLKTQASEATLPVDRYLIERLAQHVERHPRLLAISRSAVRSRQRSGYAAPPDEGLVVTNRLGGPVKSTNFRDKWRQAVELAGLPSKTRFHDLRHFYTSQLGACGHDPKTVQALSRHADMSETWDTYAHPPVAVEGVKVTAFGAMFDLPEPTRQDRSGEAVGTSHCEPPNHAA